MRIGRSVKLVQRLLTGLCAALTLSVLFPMTACLSSLGQCERQNPSVNQCAGRSEKECGSIPGCTALPSCVHHCIGLARTDCDAASDCFWYTDTSECTARSDACSSSPLATCTQNPACRAGTSCQGDVDCGSISGEDECHATAGCYYQQGLS